MFLSTFIQFHIHGYHIHDQGEMCFQRSTVSHDFSVKRCENYVYQASYVCAPCASDVGDIRVHLSISHMWGNKVAITYMVRMRCVLRGPLYHMTFQSKGVRIVWMADGFKTALKKMVSSLAGWLYKSSNIIIGSYVSKIIKQFHMSGEYRRA